MSADFNREEGKGGTAALGFIPSSTSQTASRKELLLCPVEARLKQMKKSVLNSARLLRASLEGGSYRMAMVTLTYRKVGEWRPNHMSAFMDHVRTYMKRRFDLRTRYVWVAELQERGAVHYHCLIWLPKGVTLPKPDKRGWWPHGMTRVEWAKKAIGYLTKYVSKLQSKTVAFPRGLRICGSGGLDADGRNERAWWRLPNYVREVWGIADCVRPAVGGGFVAKASGEWMASRYRFAGLHFGQIKLIDLWEAGHA